MKFTLKYRGDRLTSAGNSSSRRTEKQELRYEFHRQIRRVWENHNVLRAVIRSDLQQLIRNGDDWDVQRPIRSGTTDLDGFMFRRRLRDLWFIPMITMPMEAHCHLALRIGRPMKPGRLIFEGGDLDGRLKTLFDALAMPKDERRCRMALQGMTVKFSVFLRMTASSRASPSSRTSFLERASASTMLT
jgi:hypothetical protein